MQMAPGVRPEDHPAALPEAGRLRAVAAEVDFWHDSRPGTTVHSVVRLVEASVRPVDTRPITFPPVAAARPAVGDQAVAAVVEASDQSVVCLLGSTLISTVAVVVRLVAAVAVLPADTPLVRPAAAVAGRPVEALEQWPTERRFRQPRLR